MESIKFNDRGHSVEFSKRSLFIDNKEYLYTGISQVKHSSAYHAYLFRYQGEWVKLFYEEPHGKTIAALFKKSNAMNARRAAKARATRPRDPVHRHRCDRRSPGRTAGAESSRSCSRY